MQTGILGWHIPKYLCSIFIALSWLLHCIMWFYYLALIQVNWTELALLGASNPLGFEYSGHLPSSSSSFNFPFQHPAPQINYLKSCTSIFKPKQVLAILLLLITSPLNDGLYDNMSRLYPSRFLCFQKSCGSLALPSWIGVLLNGEKVMDLYLEKKAIGERVSSFASLAPPP